MSIITRTTSSGTNYRGTTNNSEQGGSHIIGWDRGNVRSEVYSFTTSNLPVSGISFVGPDMSLGNGAMIPVRCAISTSQTDYVNSSGNQIGYGVQINKETSISISLAANTTYYITFFPATTKNSGTWFGWYSCDKGNPFTINISQIDYTKCTAPTTIWIDNTITIPGQHTTLHWSGARAGTNMSISGYDVFRSTNLSSGYTQIGSTTSTSYSVQSPTARGSTYYYKIRTRGSIQSYDSDLSTEYRYVRANSLPDAPNVSADRTTIPSTGGEVNFTVTAGADNDNQTRTLYYSTSNSSEKQNFTSPLSVTLSNNITYYFYTYDGIEFSSATLISITLNVKPSITLGLPRSISSYDALGGTGNSIDSGGYQHGYAYAVTPQISANKTGNLMVIAELEDSNDYSSPFEKKEEYSFPDYSMSSISNVILNDYDLHTAAKQIAKSDDEPRDIHWRLKFILNDGVEKSDAVYWPANGYYYTIARDPTLLDSYNQFDTEDIPGTNAGRVWRQVRMKFYNDTSVTIISVAATIGGKAISPTSSTSVDSNGVYRYVDVTLPDNIVDGSKIIITASLTNASNSITKTVTCNVIETFSPTIGDIIHDAEIIYPFTETGDYQISTGWPFGSYETIESALSAYDCSTNQSVAIKFIHASDTSGSNQVIKTLTWERSGDNFVTTMNRATAYGWNHELGYSTYAGIQTYYCQLQITNLFGKTFTSNWLERKFNFNEKAQSPKISAIKWAETNTASTIWQPFKTGADASDDAVQEKMYLHFGLTFGLFTEDKITVNLQLTNDAGTSTVLTKEYQTNELLRATNRQVASNTVEFVYGPVGNISTSNDRKWTFEVTTTGGTVTSAETTTRVQRQTAPTINFLTCTTTQDYNLTYEFTQTNTGGGNITNYLYGDGVDLSESLNPPENDDKWLGTVNSSVTEWDVKSICVHSVSTIYGKDEQGIPDGAITGLIHSEKNYYSNYILVYQISPTVAYRKNQLGINTDAPTPGAVIDIHQSTGTNLILFQGQDTASNTYKFEINVVNGKIIFYQNGTKKHTLNMMDGTLT